MQKRIFTWILVIGIVLGLGASAAASTGSQQIEVQYRDISIVVDGKTVATEVEPFLYQDRTFVPLRAVAEALGKEVTWDQEKGQVIIGTAPSELTTITATSTTGNEDSTDWLSITAQGSSFLAVSSGGTLLRSSDGEDWKSSTIPGGNHLRAVTSTSTPNLFVVVGENGVCWTSPDGSNWTGRETGTQSNLNGVAYGCLLYTSPSPRD